MFFRRSLPASIAILSLGCASVVLAQSERGTISGTIRDSSGAVIAQAKIIITNTATNVVVNLTTNAIGEYTAASVAVGTYNVQVQKEGFRPAELKGLGVDAATSVRADVTLEIGQSQQVVEVQAAAVQLHTEDAKTSVTINQKLVDTLPLVVAGAVRSPFDLAALTPEAKTGGGDAGFALGGGQAAAYQATLDGISVDTSRALQKTWVTTNAPSVEALT